MSHQSSTDTEIQPVSRRRFLLSAGVGAAGGGAGALLLRETPTSRHDDTTAETVTERTEGVAESASPYAIWQYHYNDDGNRNNLSPVSPINVVFPLENATFEDMKETILDAGWVASPMEYTLWAWDHQSGEYRRPDWSAAETFFGLGGRAHVRIWQFGGTASMQAHIDSPVLPRHEVTSYTAASAAIEGIFEDAGWSVTETINLENSNPPDHDGHAHVIRQ